MTAPARFLALGDSYTFGEGAPPDARWPAQLAALLQREGMDVAEPMVLAVTGWTTDDLADAISLARLSPPYDLVTLLIGVNDQYRGYPAEAYEQGFIGLLHTALEFAGDRPERLVVLSIPDYSVVPFAQTLDAPAIRATLDHFNAINRRHARNMGARYVDLTSASRAAADDPTLVAPDGLHPSGKMYVEWARLVEPYAAQALRSDE